MVDGKNVDLSFVETSGTAEAANTREGESETTDPSLHSANRYVDSDSNGPRENIATDDVLTDNSETDVLLPEKALEKPQSSLLAEATSVTPPVVSQKSDQDAEQEDCSNGPLQSISKPNLHTDNAIEGTGVAVGVATSTPPLVSERGDQDAAAAGCVEGPLHNDNSNNKPDADSDNRSKNGSKNEAAPIPPLLSQEADQHTANRVTWNTARGNVSELGTPSGEVRKSSKVLSFMYCEEKQFPPRGNLDEILVSAQNLEQEAPQRITPHFSKLRGGFLMPEEMEDMWPDPQPRETRFDRPNGARSGTDNQERRRGSRRIRGETADDAKKSSRIGIRYQAMTLPKAGTFKDDGEDCGEILWDPSAALQAESSGANVYSFVEPPSGQYLTAKMLLVKSLHQAGYNTEKGMELFQELREEETARSKRDPCAHLAPDDVAALHRMFCNQTRSKDFRVLAEATGHSLDTVIVEYYLWKSSHPKEYKVAKRKRKRSKESDYCDVCDDGGRLIICDLCRRAYHLECLNPPLEEVPKGHWFCENCAVRSPARAGTNGSSVHQSPQRSIGNSMEFQAKKIRYNVNIPKVKGQGLLISIGSHKETDGVVFCGYRKMPDNSMGYAERNQLFRQPGDMIIMVNEDYIKGMSFARASETIKRAIQNERDSVSFVVEPNQGSKRKLQQGFGEEQSSAKKVAHESTSVSASSSYVRQTVGGGNPSVSVGNQIEAGYENRNGDPTLLSRGPQGLSPQSNRNMQMESYRPFHWIGPRQVQSQNQPLPRGPGQWPMQMQGIPQGSYPANGLVAGQQSKAPGFPSASIPGSAQSTLSNAIQRAIDSNPKMNPSGIYSARVPLTDGSLYLIVEDVNGTPCVTGLRKRDDGSPSKVMLANSIRNMGDEILAIDGKPVGPLHFDDVVELLLDNDQKAYRDLLMLAAQNG